MIFTFWINGDASAENDSLLPQSATAWREQYPEMMVYSDREAIEVLEGLGAENVDLYRRIRIPACKSDLARLLLLYRYGGLYIDSHTGPGSAHALVHIFGLLANYEIVLFDKTWEHKTPNDISLINGVMCVRRRSPTIKYLIESALQNLHQLEKKENEAKCYVPYNIFVVTGSWNIRSKLFDSTKDGVNIKSQFKDLVNVYPIKQGVECGFVLYKYYGYRKEGMHWSERQTKEPLFLPREA